MVKAYCTQNNGDCSTCSLTNYNRDCQNNVIAVKTAHINIRIDPMIKRKAEQDASKARMTLTQYIEMLITTANNKKGEK